MDHHLPRNPDFEARVRGSFAQQTLILMHGTPDERI
jgi:hypothetical protein